MSIQIDLTTYRSPNFDRRPAGIDSIVLHTTEGAWPSDAKWLCNPQVSGKYDPVSCHYVIAPDGTIYQLVEDTKRAWHAGSGSYLGITDWNDGSIGIELSHLKVKPIASAQKEAVRELCLVLIRRYQIQQKMIAAHRWIAPKRRTDPSDWSDMTLRQFIADLYAPTEPDWQREFGDQPFVAHFGFGQKYMEVYRAGRPLGQARGPERAELEGYTTQVLTNGILLYEHADGRVREYREVT